MKDLRVGLFVPCYIDQFYPQVAVATLQLLEGLGCRVVVPRGQTCCGQPMANAGFERFSKPAMKHFAGLFMGVDYVVGPTGSCVLHLREHLHRVGNGPEIAHLSARTFELCDFLVEVLGVSSTGARFPHRVGLHNSCHGLRGLRLGTASELRLPPSNKVRSLLESVEGLELVDLDRQDECCGFGGTFAVLEPDVSAAMGRDRLADHVRNGTEVVTGTDMSCLMHLEGLSRRQGLPLRFLHVAEILAGGAE